MCAVKYIPRLAVMGLALLSLFAAAISAGAQDAQAPRRLDDSHYYEFESPDASFVVWAPKGWAPSAAPTRQGSYLLRNPESLKEGAIPEVLMISIYPGELDTEIKGIVDQTKAALAARYTDVKTLVDERSVVGNGRGWRLVCDATDQKGVRLRAGMQMGVVQAKIVIITFSAPPRRYEEIGALVDRAAATFLFLPPKPYERDRPAVFEDQRRGVRLTFPTGFRPSTKLDRGVLLHLLTPIRGTQRHVRKSIMVGAYPAAGQTVQQAVEAFRQDVTGDGARILDVRDAKLGTLPARRVVYTQRGDLGAGRRFTAKLAFYIAPRGDDMYFLYVKADEDDYDEFHGVAQKIIDSIEWFDSKQPN